MTSKKTVLFILMEFPPVNTTGNYRSLKFIKYLGNYGIDPIVVTFLESEAASYFKTNINSELLEELPENCKVYRVHCKSESKSILPRKYADFLRIYFSIKDSFARRWSPFLFGEIADIIKRHQPSVVYTSLPPFSSGLLTKKIADKHHLPYVLDMRDLWSDWGIGPKASRIHYWLTKYEEHRIFKGAEKILAVTPQMIEILKNKNPSIQPNKFRLIYNGFDFSLDELTPFRFEAGKKKVLIGYMGSFYYEPSARSNSFKPWWKKKGHKMLQYEPSKQDWLYRSPYFFFKTVSAFIRKYPQFEDVIEIEFIGRKEKWLTDMVADFALTDQVRMHGFVAKNEALKIMDNWDLLLATSEKVIGGEHYCLPSKLFDYISVRKALLGFVTNGIQRQFIEYGQLGICCNPDDINESVDLVFDLITNGKEFNPNKEYLKRFQINNITKQLAENL